MVKVNSWDESQTKRRSCKFTLNLAPSGYIPKDVTTLFYSECIVAFARSKLKTYTKNPKRAEDSGKE